MTELPVICSFWHGDLGWLGRICIASFLERGHRFELYAYGDVGAVPAGCVLRDASTIIPQAEMFFYKGNRTPAVFADLFRLKLMQQRAGIWVDCDVYCVQSFAGLGDYVYGRETSGESDTQMVNNAVFACPPGELLDALLRTFEPGALPPGMPWFRALEVRIRRLFGEALPVQDMQFGATGPWPLNYHLKRLGLFERAQHKPVFYPMNYGEARKLIEPGVVLADLVQPTTLSAHFWHSSLTDRGSGALTAPAPGSFFSREIERLGAAFSF